MLMACLWCRTQTSKIKVSFGEFKTFDSQLIIIMNESYQKNRISKVDPIQSKMYLSDFSASSQVAHTELRKNEEAD